MSSAAQLSARFDAIDARVARLTALLGIQLAPSNAGIDAMAPPAAAVAAPCLLPSQPLPLTSDLQKQVTQALGSDLGTATEAAQPQATAAPATSIATADSSHPSALAGEGVVHVGPQAVTPAAVSGHQEQPGRGNLLTIPATYTTTCRSKSTGGIASTTDGTPGSDAVDTSNETEPQIKWERHGRCNLPKFRRAASAPGAETELLLRGTPCPTSHHTPAAARAPAQEPTACHILRSQQQLAEGMLSLDKLRWEAEQAQQLYEYRREEIRVWQQAGKGDSIPVARSFKEVLLSGGCKLQPTETQLARTASNAQSTALDSSSNSEISDTESSMESSPATAARLLCTLTTTSAAPRMPAVATTENTAHPHSAGNQLHDVQQTRNSERVVRSHLMEDTPQCPPTINGTTLHSHAIDIDEDEDECDNSVTATTSRTDKDGHCPMFPLSRCLVCTAEAALLAAIVAVTQVVVDGVASVMRRSWLKKLLTF